MGLSLALLHYPMTSKLGGAPVCTSVTNFDIHDIARASATFGLDRYFIVTPIEMQRDFVRRIMRYWLEQEGAQYNPTRGEALMTTEILPDLAAVGAAIGRDFGSEPYWVATSAKASSAMIRPADLRRRLDDGENVCLLFGTGYGIHPDLFEHVDAVLEPISGPTPFMHLSVRSAVSIYLDRICAR